MNHILTLEYQEFLCNWWIYFDVCQPFLGYAGCAQYFDCFDNVRKFTVLLSVEVM
jgi:hypothetical protein